MTKLQLYRPLSDAEPNMAEDSATGQFYWAADADTEIEALIRERHQLQGDFETLRQSAAADQELFQAEFRKWRAEQHQLRNELTAARLEGDRLRKALKSVQNLAGGHPIECECRQCEIFELLEPIVGNTSPRNALEPSEVYDKIGVLRPDGEFTTYEGCEGEPVYVRHAEKSGGGRDGS